MSHAYRTDQELPGLPIEWRDADDEIINFSSGWTFTARLAAASAPNVVLATKTTGISGAATSPNVLIEWAAGVFDDLTPAADGSTYLLHLYARRTSDSKDRVFRPGRPPEITIYPAPA